MTVLQVREFSTKTPAPAFKKPKVALQIDGTLVSVDPTATVLQACDEAGIVVPRFCYHDSLAVAGNCRICLVEVDRAPKPVASCAIPVAEGMIVRTQTPLVRKARESVMGFILGDHPIDCPVCDQAGGCDLQDEAQAYGSDQGLVRSSYKTGCEKKNLGPIVETVITRCISCTRCVRASEDNNLSSPEAHHGRQDEATVLGQFGRGTSSEIGTYAQGKLPTTYSGILADICPVGALLLKPSRGKVRKWELKTAMLFDTSDAIGTPMEARFKETFSHNQKRTEIVEVVPKRAVFRERSYHRPYPTMITDYGRLIPVGSIAERETSTLSFDELRTYLTFSMVEEDPEWTDQDFLFTHISSVGSPIEPADDHIFEMNEDMDEMRSWRMDPSIGIGFQDFTTFFCDTESQIRDRQPASLTTLGIVNIAMMDKLHYGIITSWGEKPIYYSSTEERRNENQITDSGTWRSIERIAFGTVARHITLSGKRVRRLEQGENLMSGLFFSEAETPAFISGAVVGDGPTRIRELMEYSKRFLAFRSSIHNSIGELLATQGAASISHVGWTRRWVTQFDTDLDMGTL